MAKAKGKAKGKASDRPEQIVITMSLSDKNVITRYCKSIKTPVARFARKALRDLVDAAVAAGGTPTVVPVASAPEQSQQAAA